jgi:hypothetical protein
MNNGRAAGRRTENRERAREARGQYLIRSSSAFALDAELEYG